MAISTETENLIEFYNQKIILDQNQISQLNTVQVGYEIRTGIGTTERIKIFGPSELIQNYNVPIEKLDSKIVEINTQIANYQSQILSLGQQANAVGCGTEFWSVGFTSVTVVQDVTNYKGYTYSGRNPFEQISGQLTSSNAGIGTEDYITQPGIGTYYEPIEICLSIFTCSNEICSGYATSIANLQAQIEILRDQRDPLIEKVNTLKNNRSDFQLQKYSYDESEVRLNAQLQRTEEIISFLNDPENNEWL
jgi:hypothetical protein